MAASLLTMTSSLASLQSSLNAVPNLAAYIAALTPAVTAYNALGPTLFTDFKSQITSINSSITLVNTPWRHLTSPCPYSLMSILAHF